MSVQCPNTTPVRPKKNVVYIHGFNEDPLKALGNLCETFKRFYWSGSKAKFTGVEWFGNRSIPAGSHYHYDVTNAFITAPYLADYIKALKANQEEVNLIAFSLGNMVASSAIQDFDANQDRYFMLHAAVAKEAYDATEYDADMIQINWRNYDHRFYASKWYELPFATNDCRRTLKWPGRFAKVATVNTYNYFSSGENVLDDLHDGWGAPGTLADVACPTSGRYAWCVQELFKGRAPDHLGGSRYGGWGFDFYSSDPVYGHWDLSSGDYALYDSTNDTPPSQLRTKPVFLPYFHPDPLLGYPSLGILDTHDLYKEPDNPDGIGSKFARDNRGILLAEMIPALSFATGRHALKAMPNSRNIDMSTLENEWPTTRNAADWHHGDFKTVAYAYVYKVFDDIGKTKGQFDQ